MGMHMKALWIRTLVVLIFSFFIFSSFGFSKSEARECTLTAYVTEHHTSAGLSCDDASVEPFIVGFGPSVEKFVYILVAMLILLLLVILFAKSRTLLIFTAVVGTLFVFSGGGYGEIEEEEELHELFMKGSSQKREIRISKEQALQVRKYVEDTKKDCEGSSSQQCRYYFIGRNCIDYVQELFELVGHDEHFTSSFPSYGGAKIGFYGYVRSVLEGNAI